MKICLHQQNYICASSQIDFVQACTGNAVILVLWVVVQTSNRHPGGFCWRNASAFGPEIYTGVHAILDFKQFVVSCSFYVWRPEWNEMKGKMTVWIKIFFFPPKECYTTGVLCMATRMIAGMNQLVGKYFLHSHKQENCCSLENENSDLWAWRAWSQYFALLSYSLVTLTVLGLRRCRFSGWQDAMD